MMGGRPRLVRGRGAGPAGLGATLPRSCRGPADALARPGRRPGDALAQSGRGLGGHLLGSGRELGGCLPRAGPGLLRSLWEGGRRLGGAVLILLAASSAADAHGLAPGLLALSGADGDYRVRWRAPSGGADDGPRPAVELAWPSGCRPRTLAPGGDTARFALSCLGTLTGSELGVRPRDATRWEVLLIARVDGAEQRAVLSPTRPNHRIAEAPRASVLADLTLGVEHILTGWDHLGFLLALLLWIHHLRPLLAAVTAFTVGHSLTLALAALELIRIPSAPVELFIAGSVLLLARQSVLRKPADDPIGARTAPTFAVALLFGLVHGLGFAGALAELGLERAQQLSTLVAFNLGVEMGQLIFLVPAAIVLRMARRAPRGRRALSAAPHLLGAISAFWVFERLGAL